ncbi:hypothetical protein CDL12_17375 [Handroanthus impetiginosus]|uniref:AT3G52170-like helix-turn-helix domain-containing protein n=1 Tax=Handroanthus impetiginosus TaxID=429701 RepID=A0A2G9GYF6_9LAMI|nr:hypothetical protein CDL12_17375 [Handroanthus impetiginosus]
MQAIKAGWVGQTFALATSNGTGGKKSRTRHSKEERKIMVESFINKYRKLNNGNFPSLSLTQKEVGGSFYTVREIFREIIQENRVLASPRVPLDENNQSVFLERHPLGSISVEPQNDSSVSDKHHFVTPMEPNQHQITSEELISSSSDKFENEKIVNHGEGLEENIESDEHFTAGAVTINHQDDNDEAADLSTQEIRVLGSHWLGGKQHLSKNNQIVDKTEESREEIYTGSLGTSEKDGSSNVEVSEANSDMETFPSRPDCGMILDLDGESHKLDEANKYDKMALVESNGSVDEKDLERPLDSMIGLNGEHKDGKVVQNLQEPSSENSKVSSSLPDENNARSSTQQLISEDAMAFVTKSRVQEKTLLKKGNNLVLERLNLETWKRTSKKSTRLENNPLLTFVKAFISAFVKFWTE